MPRPKEKIITFTIDGIEVQAPENSMLVDAAKHGDVEIPVFCYERKLGNPVGACRMCLVEIEGLPKLQTGCSTPVKDGMVVHTLSERVETAQRGVVEFLLINHPLDCPVCDKGGECPLQDISFGWGGGVSRHLDAKRHFVKPLALSEKIAIDRERCILCYRCVRFSQDVSEDHQLVLLERGAHSYVATFDGHPYQAPFSGNIVELCPVGALTALPYRFRARPWDIEDSGTVCTYCPAQCNVSLTIRDERVLRALARENDEVDNGWLCDRGRFLAEEVHGPARITSPMVRDGGTLRPVSWDRALQQAAGILRRAGQRSAALIGGQATNEEGFLLSRLMREGLGSPHIDSRPAGRLPLHLLRQLSEPCLQAKVSDLEYADVVLLLGCEPQLQMPILDLRIRKGIRHRKLTLVVASERKSALDRRAALTVRYAQGRGEEFAVALAACLSPEQRGDVERLAAEAGCDLQSLAKICELLRGSRVGVGSSPAGEPAAGQEVVILWGEALTSGDDRIQTAEALLDIAESLNLHQIEGAGLLEVPSGANLRGLREIGALPNAGPGLCEPTVAAGEADRREGGSRIASQEEGGLGFAEICSALAAGELTAVHLLRCDPLADLERPEAWHQALAKAGVIAHAAHLTEGVSLYADVVFPAESHPEKEGTVVHPDGRIQRLRPVIGNQGENRPEWLVIADLALMLGLDLQVDSAPSATAQLVEAVPFYEGITLQEIGGKGVRWQEREAAAAFPSAEGARAR